MYRVVREMLPREQFGPDELDGIRQAGCSRHKAVVVVLGVGSNNFSALRTLASMSRRNRVPQVMLNRI